LFARLTLDAFDTFVAKYVGRRGFPIHIPSGPSSRWQNG
jgi:hypothetical protein